MPWHDHFHPPSSERRPWESFHATWCSTLADHLNHDLLPSGYIPLEQVHRGPAIDIDVGTFAEEGPSAPGSMSGDGSATLTCQVWLPAAPPVSWPAVFPERFTVVHGRRENPGGGQGIEYSNRQQLGHNQPQKKIPSSISSARNATASGSLIARTRMVARAMRVRPTRMAPFQKKCRSQRCRRG